MIEQTAIDIERNTNGDYVIRWRSMHPGQKVSIYLSGDPECFYSAQSPGMPVAQTTDEMALVPNPDKGARHYFLLDFADSHHVVIAERRVSLQGAPNFRDLGGYEGSDGRHLKWGRLYRSSKLSALSETDLDYLQRLGVTLICDFRQTVEQELEPTVLWENPTHVVAHLPIMPGSSQSFLDSLFSGVIDVKDSAVFMETLNRELVATQMPRYAQMFEFLLAKDQRLLIHCASGKDRTGFGAALILDVLGVAEEEIVADYLLTNACLPLEKEMERLAAHVTDSSGGTLGYDVLRPMLEVRPEYILACFEEIRLRYNSKQHFYQTALGLDQEKIERLRENYLY
ncbi:MAG: tyrosine-protein phosphatase [Halioglobus sp.]